MRFMVPVVLGPIFLLLEDLETRGTKDHICVLLYTVGDQLGRAILGGGCLFGIGSLCYYGLGLSGEAGAIDRAG